MDDRPACAAIPSAVWFSGSTAKSPDLAPPRRGDCPETPVGGRKGTRTRELVISMIVLARFIKWGILLGLLSQVTPVFARASSFEDHIWNAQYIDGLPPEVRSALTRMCGPDLAAQRYFAGYLENSKFLVLHFGRLRCGDQGAICTQGRCLHQVYGKEGDRYHLLKSYYGPDD
jgi:hypothetical protein